MSTLYFCRNTVLAAGSKNKCLIMDAFGVLPPIISTLVLTMDFFLSQICIVFAIVKQTLKMKNICQKVV